MQPLINMKKAGPKSCLSVLYKYLSTVTFSSFFYSLRLSTNLNVRCGACQLIFDHIHIIINLPLHPKNCVLTKYLPVSPMHMRGFFIDITDYLHRLVCSVFSLPLFHLFIRIRTISRCKANIPFCLSWIGTNEVFRRTSSQSTVYSILFPCFGNSLLGPCFASSIISSIA